MSGDDRFHRKMEENRRLALEATKLYAELLEAREREEAEEERRRNRPKRAYVERNREDAHARLHADYFADQPTYGPDIFRRRFRMRRDLFKRIVTTLEAREPYFQQLPDAIGRMGLSAIQKCTVALRQLANGGAPDQYDEYLRIGESTGRKCLKEFCSGVIAAFGAEYLRKPTAADCDRLLQMHEEKHGFPGMLGSIDCMHWEWKNCPTAWKGAFTNQKKGHPTIVLEAVASQDLWIWHAFFGVAGSNNDINVLNQSDVFNDLLNGKAPSVTFNANGKQYNMGYYLADGIYPDWPTFVKTLPCPTDPMRALFAQKQEAARKDVERAFGVLQARWAMIHRPARLFFEENLVEVMYACIILHNMIVQDEGEHVSNWVPEDASSSTNNGGVTRGATGSFEEFLKRKTDLRNARAHATLQNDLIEEIWERFG